MCVMARDDPHFRLRVPETLKAQVEDAARASGRSMNAEIVFRLEQSFRNEALRPHADALIRGEEFEISDVEDLLTALASKVADELAAMAAKAKK